ncbi:MAG: hypothetical protein K1X36_04005 [Pyrinomonadaceae bacterium]|nr:hypothetical protein [Pyrinomonadaceae bacterium]
MFCPGCGNADQIPESFCRQCGIFLPDLTKPIKGPVPPEQHLTANLVLGSMTIAVSFSLAVLLSVFLGFRPDTNPLIYVTAGLLIAIGCWHVQTVWRTILLKKHLKTRFGHEELVLPGSFQTGKLLNVAELSNAVPASVTEDTTSELSRSAIRSSQSQH